MLKLFKKKKNTSSDIPDINSISDDVKNGRMTKEEAFEFITERLLYETFIYYDLRADVEWTKMKINYELAKLRDIKSKIEKKVEVDEYDLMHFKNMQNRENELKKHLHQIYQMCLFGFQNMISEYEKITGDTGSLKSVILPMTENKKIRSEAIRLIITKGNLNFEKVTTQDIEYFFDMMLKIRPYYQTTVINDNCQFVILQTDEILDDNCFDKWPQI